MSTSEPEVFERIALSRLPELQTASGLFRPTARVEGVEDEGAVPTPLRAGAVVLLGLLRADQAELEHPFLTGSLRTRVLGELGSTEVTAGDLGLALWAESRADGGAVSEIQSLLSRSIGKRYDQLPLEEISWVVSGLVEATVRFGEEAGLAGMLQEAGAGLAERVVKETGLLQDVHRRRRGHATPFSTQFHALNALCQLKRAGREEIEADLARPLGRSILELQREDGSWPGLVDPIRGEPVAIYPMLAVTHIAHAPTALRVAAETSLEGDFAAASVASLNWARGGNRLGFDLVHEQAARIDRGILPRREPGAVQRGFSTAARRIRGVLPEPDPARLILDPAVSSEDLGWVLEAWAGR